MPLGFQSIEPFVGSYGKSFSGLMFPFSCGAWIVFEPVPLLPFTR